MKKIYDRSIGYSPLEDVDEEKMLQVIRLNKKIIDIYHSVGPTEFILVAGAGKGSEAILIYREFGTFTVGIDLNIEKMPMLYPKEKVFLQKGNIASLAFPDDLFSVIYSYHVLEHVNNPVAVLEELGRVLKQEGVLFIGFPNKNRAFSYIGTSQKASVVDRLKWNLNDYWYRLTGKFENRFGAHAGFTEKYFRSIASRLFSSVNAVRDQYMILKYAKHDKFIRLLIRSNLSEILFPSNYFVCKGKK